MTVKKRNTVIAVSSVLLAAAASFVWLHRTGIRFADEVNYPIALAFFALTAAVTLLPKRYIYLPVAAAGAVAMCWYIKAALICCIPALCLILLYKAAVSENRDRAASRDLYFCLMTILYCVMCGVSFVACVNIASVNNVFDKFGASDFFDRDFYTVAALFGLMAFLAFSEKLRKNTASGKAKKDPGTDARAAGKLRVFSVVSFLCIPANMIYPQLFLNTEHSVTLPLFTVFLVFILYKNPFIPELISDRVKEKDRKERRG